MDQYGVDIIVTGLYHENTQSRVITLRLLVYVKESQKIVMKNIQFKQGEMVVKDAKSQQVKLHFTAEYKIQHMFRDIHEFQVDETVKKILDEIQKKKPIKFYVANLSFLNAQTQKIMEETVLTRLLNGAVMNNINQTLLQWGKKEKKKLETVFNAKGHQVANTEANVQQLVNLIFDQNLDKTQRLDSVIQRLMDPHGVDVIVTGQYVENTGRNSVTIRPIIIFKSPQNIVTHNFVFPMDQLVCQDPTGKEKMLCSDAGEKIRNEMQNKLEEIKK
jgi:hypothetical protein